MRLLTLLLTNRNQNNITQPVGNSSPDTLEVNPRSVALKLVPSGQQPREQEAPDVAFPQPLEFVSSRKSEVQENPDGSLVSIYFLASPRAGLTDVTILDAATDEPQ